MAKVKKNISSDDVEAGQRLRYVREEVLLIKSQELFAKETDIARSSVSAYELGVMEIGVKLLTKLHYKYGVNPNYIVLGQKPVRDIPDKKSALVTDLKALKSQMKAMEARVNYLAKKNRS